VPATAPDTQPWRQVPLEWRGSPAEWAIYWAHQPLRLGREGEGVWRYQPGYLLRVAGFIPDFIEEDVRVALNVRNTGGDQAREAGEIAHEALRSSIVASLGYRLAVIGDDQALADPVRWLRLARENPALLQVRMT
jgi:hypothetical protein